MGGIQELQSKGWMKKELRRLFFTLKPWLTLQPEILDSYIAALGDVAELEMAALVNQAVKTRWPDLNWCSPKELSDLLRDMRMAARAERAPEVSEECPICKGTGFEVLLIDGGRKARRCRCVAGTPRREKEKAAKAG